MLGLLFWAALVQGSAAGAPADPSPEQAPLRGPADWRRTASAKDFAEVLPARAQRPGFVGMAVIACSVTDTGRLSDCAVVEETPKDTGLGKALLKIAPKFEVRPLTAEEKAAGAGKVRIPLRVVMAP
jgi:TonB family protein